MKAEQHGPFYIIFTGKKKKFKFQDISPQERSEWRKRKAKKISQFGINR